MSKVRSRSRTILGRVPRLSFAGLPRWQPRLTPSVYSSLVRFERIAYSGHAYARMKRRRISHDEVKRIINDPEITHPSEDDPTRTVARGRADDERRCGVVYTEEHDRDADVLIITVIDFDAHED